MRALACLLLLGLASVVAAEETHTESVTIWTPRGELFMEYKPPVAGTPARFTAHLTELTRFRAVVHATATLRLHKSGGQNRGL